MIQSGDSLPGWKQSVSALLLSLISAAMSCAPSGERATSTGELARPGTDVASSPDETTEFQRPSPPPGLPKDRIVHEIAARDWLNTPSPVSLSELRGNVVMLEFWATWCGPCIEGIPHLNELQATFGPEGFQIVSLTNEDRDTVLRFQKRRAVDMNYIIGLESRTVAAYEIRGIPHAIVIGRDGDMVWRGHPMNPECEAQIKLALAR